MRAARGSAVVSALTIAHLLLSVPYARAQDSGSGALAEQLFVAGKILMQEKEYERACPKFAESYRLDPTAVGTLLNLALCHEAIGRTASAWSEFRAVAAQSVGKREDRVKLADEHARALAKDLSFLTIEVPEAAKAEGLAVRLDGAAMGEAAWGTPLPVDPGAHVLEASAPGRETWSAKVSFGTAERKTSTVAVLARAAVAPAPPAPARSHDDLIAVEAVASLRARRTVGFVVAGMGLAAVGVGSVFGVLAVNRNQAATSRCPTADQCASGGDAAASTADVRAARTDAAVANIAIGLGVAGMVGGVLLVLLSQPRRDVPSPRAAFAPVVFPNGAGGAWGGAF